MINLLKESLWRQFGASIDMPKKAIELWPEDYWNTDKKFFYMAYHTLVFLDYYLTIPVKDFPSSLPFTFTDAANIPVDAIDDLIPNRIYTKEELLNYLQSNREKCRKFISTLTEEKLNERFIENFEDGMNYSALEILLYNMRHVQHHAAQLNMMLRQRINNAPRWVARAKDDL
jgi:hypothetical protein